MAVNTLDVLMPSRKFILNNFIQGKLKRAREIRDFGLRVLELGFQRG